MVEYRTTDTDELAPYPGMTYEDLRDFEGWTKELDNRYDWSVLWPCVTVALVYLVLAGTV